MNMKKTAFIITVLIALLSASLRVRAYGEYGAPNETEGEEYEKIYELLPEEDRRYFVSGNNGTEFTGISELFGFIAQKSGDAARKYSGRFGVLLSLIILYALMRKTKFISESEELSSALLFLTSLCIALTGAGMLKDVIASLGSFFDTMNLIMTSSLPIMTSLYLYGGNYSLAAVSSSGTLFLLSGINGTVTYLLFPVMKCLAALCSVSPVGNGSLASLARILKNAFTTLIVTVMTLSSAVLAYQSVIAKHTDDLSARALRFAGGFVPVIGSAIGESIRGVMASLSLIKSKTGVAGIVVILAFTLPVILSLLINKLLLKVCVFASSSLGAEPIGNMLSGAEGILDLALASAVAVSISFIFELTVFINVAPPLGGRL